MFKRVLVLVLFLFGVFWWLTHKDNASEVQEEANTEAVEVLEETENTEEDTDTESEAADEEATDTSAETEEITAEPETEIETETVTPETPAETDQEETPVTETPTTVTPSVTQAPVVRTPVAPNRITDVKVYLYEWNIDLSVRTIPAGTVNFQVQNDGRFTHDFAIDGLGTLGKISPGDTQTFTVKLRAGEYETFSKRRQDYERGMTENFTVVN